MRALSVCVVLVLAACAGAPSRPPLLLSGAGPVYPAEARASGLAGEVTVAYDVTVDGNVTNARVVASEPPGVFDASALATVASWRFKPQLIDGVPTPARNMTRRVRFVPDGSHKYDQYRPPPEE